MFELQRLKLEIQRIKIFEFRFPYKIRFHTNRVFQNNKLSRFTKVMTQKLVLIGHIPFSFSRAKELGCVYISRGVKIAGDSLSLGNRKRFSIF